MSCFLAVLSLGLVLTLYIARALNIFVAMILDIATKISCSTASALGRVELYYLAFSCFNALNGVLLQR